MAFIPSSTTLVSSFAGRWTTKRSTCPSKAPVMLSSEDYSTGLKFLLIGGAFALTTAVAVPRDAHAAIFHFSGQRPQNIGVKYGRYLQGCPATPNCISSMEDPYDSHYVPPWTYNAGQSNNTKSMKDAIADVTKVIQEYPRTKIITKEATTSDVGDGYYIYAEFESKLLGFVDDVEFFFQPDNTSVEYRSASRLGESDLDANRKRIRDLRVALQEMDKRWASTGYN
ncbi:hypothetical protein BWQ96_05295 [Gracilariopsis chorda]|uniref:DUF1499 domain-containing protein n=1 Tax=Gracilariopsis chorda TaxID=448386 RepID=A0A2V3IS39_9FLOR|nr:hypothetical protein BWQ96_05295 [Gracilariopsis chorda]|eukprot:PXF44931.1 hypothetical protein BWQ96_05295 [Gracilariopsis chorda]